MHYYYTWLSYSDIEKCVTSHDFSCDQSCVRGQRHIDENISIHNEFLPDGTYSYDALKNFMTCSVSEYKRNSSDTRIENRLLEAIELCARYLRNFDKTSVLEIGYKD